MVGWDMGDQALKATTGSIPAAEWVAIDTLAPWDKNPRRNDEAAKEVAKSIQRFGFGAPILARAADRVVIAGHTRLKAAALLGLDKVPVRFLDLDPAEARALALADNKLGELAEWDAEVLGDVLRELEADGAVLDGLGFSEEELRAIVDGAGAVGEDEWGNALGDLPEGDRAPIQTMTFTLHDDQAEDVKRAIQAARDMGEFGDTGNENGNGNALARVCEMFLARCADG